MMYIMYYIVLQISIHISCRNVIMVDSVQPLDWDLLNTDQKYEFCGKSVRRAVTDSGFGCSSGYTVCNCKS